MIAKRLEDLFVWRLASETRSALIAITARPAFRADFRLRSQLRDCANSAEANISEGFARFYPKDFARFLRYARASANELLTHLSDAHDRHLITEAERARHGTTCRRLSKALLQLIRYLEASDEPPCNPADRGKRRPPRPPLSDARPLTTGKRQRVGHERTSPET